MFSEPLLPEELAILRQVRIPVGHGEVSVPDHLLDVFDVCTAKDQVRAEGVPKIMEVKILDPRYPAC